MIKKLSVSVCVPDLFFQVKLVDVLKHLNIPFSMQTLQQATGDIIIANLEDPGVLEYEFPEKLLCFCSHVKEDLIDKAKQKGITVKPRMQFFKTFPSLIKQAIIPKERILDFNQLQELFSSQEPYLLLDVREKDELSYGMLPGAKHFPLSSLYLSLAQTDEQFRRDNGFDKPTKDQLIVVYCRTHNRSQEVFTALYDLGYNVKQYVGGTNEYALHDHSVMQY